jgi:hypothetical protein
VWLCYHAFFYDEKTATLVSTLDADKHRTTERLDGCYLLKSNRKDLTGDEIWRIYILLTRAEDAFRDMKSPLVIRPILHTHTQGHATATMQFDHYARVPLPEDDPPPFRPAIGMRA